MISARASVAGPTETGFGVAAGFAVGRRVGVGAGVGEGLGVSDGLGVGDGLAVGDAACVVLDEGLGLPVGELQPISRRAAMAMPPRRRIDSTGARISPRLPAETDFGCTAARVAQWAPPLGYG